MASISNINNPTNICSNDLIDYHPTQSRFTVCGVHKDGLTLVLNGQPFPTIVRTSDCTLIENRNVGQSMPAQIRLIAAGLEDYLDTNPIDDYIRVYNVAEEI